MREKHIQRLMLAMAFISLTAASLVMAGATENEPVADSSRFIERFDKNGDGQVAEEEFPGATDHFTRLDQDGDGFISSAEAPEPMRHGRPGGFEEDDADRDGKVSEAEFSGPEDLFQKLDADGDGYLTREEGMPRRPHGNPESDADQAPEP